MNEFTQAVEQGNHKQLGWPSAAYAVSKSGVTGMTRVVAREERQREKDGGRKGVLILVKEENI